MTPVINGYRKNQKLRLGVTIGAFVCAIALLLSYVAVYTVSKYTREIKGYTNFEVSPMHAYLLGDMTRDELLNAWESSYDELRLFGTDVSLDKLEPGMDRRDLPFTIANATGTEKISGTDLDYTLRLRTTGNIPLKYTLYAVDVSVSSSGLEDEVREKTVLKTFRTSDNYYIEDTGNNNAPKYVYPFYEVIDDGMGGTTLDTMEAKFVMSGGILVTDSYVLSIEWPVPEGSDADSMKYMKEVDIVDILANVSSRNRSLGYDPDAAVTPEYYSEGILVAYPGAEWGEQLENGAEYYTFKYDYRGFRILESNASVTSSAFRFRVSNGNNLYKDNIAKLADNTSDRTNFTIQFAFPVSEDTKEDREYYFSVDGIFSDERGKFSAELYSSAINGESSGSSALDFSAVSSAGVLNLNSSAVEYRMYDIRDWSVVATYADADEALDAAAARAENAADDYMKSRYRVYKVYTPLDAQGNGYVFTLRNKSGDNDVCDWLDFEIIMEGAPVTGVVACENIPMIFATASYENDIVEIPPVTEPEDTSSETP